MDKYQSKNCYQFLFSKDYVSMNAIICNDVDFKPMFHERVIWKLITPLPFIQALNNENIPLPALLPPISNLTTIFKKPSIDITALAFNNKEEFEAFLYEYQEI